MQFLVRFGSSIYKKRKSVRGRRFSKGVNSYYVLSQVNISSRESKKVRLIAYSNSIHLYLFSLKLRNKYLWIIIGAYILNYFIINIRIRYTD